MWCGYPALLHYSPKVPPIPESLQPIIVAKRVSLHTAVDRLRPWLPNLEPIVLVVLAVGTASLWGFIEIAEDVFEGDTEAFDRWAVSAMRDRGNPADPVGPRWVEEMARDASALGGFAWITFATFVIAIFLLLDGKSHMAAFLAAATTSGAVVSFLLKSVFERPRPDLVPHLSHVYTSSFPSGHSMNAAVVYLTLGSLLASVISNVSLKIYVLAIAVALTIAVGLSRIYLGVHYPTDVLAGWLAGLVWALVCWLIARWLQRRGQVEKPPIKSVR
jgi:undecaprenyl-diphosphatase